MNLQLVESHIISKFAHNVRMFLYCAIANHGDVYETCRSI